MLSLSCFVFPRLFFQFPRRIFRRFVAFGLALSLAADPAEIDFQVVADAAANPLAPSPEVAALASDAEAIKKATIVAAMERARAQREAVRPRNTERLSAEQEKEIAAIEARRRALQPDAERADAASTPPRTAE